MIVLGIVLLVLGLLFSIPILYSLGALLLVIGVVLIVLGTAGPVGGRWW